MKRVAWIGWMVVALQGLTAEAPFGPEVDRVGFPTQYATRFVVLRTVEREEGKKLVTVYGNTQADSVKDKSQLPYPQGAVIVMETARTKLGSDGKPVRDAAGLLHKEEVLGLHVMRRGKDFGEAYREKRSGEWEFAEYKPDASFITPPQRSSTCAECHIKAGKDRDFVYQARFAK